MSKQRLDRALVGRGLVATRSQAESYIKLDEVKVDGKVVAKPGFLVSDEATIVLTAKEQYVSRAALKLASVASALKLDFTDKVVLDVGSSTGGFTDYALQHGARKVIAIEVGTDQLHQSLRGNPKVELYEKTNVLDVRVQRSGIGTPVRSDTYIQASDIALVDVSFVSVRELLPHISELLTRNSELIVMVKPQFEAGNTLKHKGVIKNDKMRREILKGFEAWAHDSFMILSKADSEVAGEKGNRERFYLLKKFQ